MSIFTLESNKLLATYEGYEPWEPSKSVKKAHPNEQWYKHPGTEDIQSNHSLNARYEDWNVLMELLYKIAADCPGFGFNYQIWHNQTAIYFNRLDSDYADDQSVKGDFEPPKANVYLILVDAVNFINANPKKFNKNERNKIQGQR